MSCVRQHEYSLDIMNIHQNMNEQINCLEYCQVLWHQMHFKNTSSSINISQSNTQKNHFLIVLLWYGAIIQKFFTTLILTAQNKEHGNFS